MNTDEGGAGSGKKLSGAASKRPIQGGQNRKNGDWLDQDMVRSRVERREDGKLGIREGEGGKFRLWRAFSGKSFDELEDLVPMRETVGSEFFAMASVFWLVMVRFRGKMGNGWTWKLEDWGILFMMYRMQCANAGCIFTRAMLEYALCDPQRPKGHSIHLTNVWVRRMRSKGLIEQVPGLRIWEGRKIAMFRLSPSGRTLLKQFLDAFRKVHEDIRYWAKNPDDAHYLRSVVARFTLGIDANNLTDESGQPVTLEDMIELTKRDLKAMGHKGVGQKPDYWPDLPD